jgi:hypothetical protein
MTFQTEVPDDGSRQASSSPYSGKGKIVPECGLVGDMYDPFVDSFEPASVKLDCVQEHEPDNDLCIVPKASISSNRPLSMEENNQAVDKEPLCESEMTARVSVSSNKPADVEENTAGIEIGEVVSGEDDEFGKNVDDGRECNSHETLTPNSDNENPKVENNVHEGDNTRKKSREKSKERDSSRSMKLFKVVLTKFVKDLLKPSWRQGNMSKEAFKTIVKRVVDKVSNSMEGRRIPKSRAKIDKYIDSSQQKLTKLVMVRNIIPSQSIIH